MNTGPWFSLLTSLAWICRLIGWLRTSPSCRAGISTLPLWRGSRVMIQRVLALFSSRLLRLLTWRVPRTSKLASSGVRSGLPN
ncbi:hypothetical protein D3C80_1128600 [compost metagenome]